jgi:tape measure domain-containing protein
MAVFDIGIIITAINRATGPINQVNQSLGKMPKQAQAASRGLRAIDVVLASIATGSAVAFAKQFAEIGSEMENLRIRLAVFEGGMGGATRRLQSLLSNFGSLPFDFGEITKAFTRLKSAGIEDTERALKSMLDALSAFGGGTDELQRLSIGIQQVAGKGVLSMEELRQQIGEAVPFAMRILAEETGRSVAQLIADVSKGAVDSKEAIEALVRGFEKNFGGLSEVLGRTMSGAIAQIRTAVKTMADRIFNDLGLGPRITIVLEEIAAKIRAFGQSISQADVDAFWEGLKNVAVFAEGVATAIINLSSVVVSFASELTGLLGSFGGEYLTYGIIGFMLFGPQGAALLIGGMAIYNVAKDFYAAIGGMDKEVKSIMQSLGAAAPFGLIGFLVLGPLGGALVTLLIAATDQLLTAIRNFVSNVLDLFGSWGEKARAVVEGVFGKEGEQTVLARSYEALSNVMKAFTQHDSEAAGAFDKATDEYVSLYDARIKAMERYNQMVNKSNISQTAISAIEGFGKMQDQIQKKIAGAETLPFMQQIEGYYQQIEEFEKQIQNEQKRYDTELSDARSKARNETDYNTALGRASGFAKSIGDMHGQAAAAYAEVERLKQVLAEAFSVELRRDVADVEDKIAKMASELTGTELDQSLAGINEQYNDINRKLTKQLETATDLNAITGKEGDLIKQINEDLGTNETLRQQAVALAHEQYAIEQRIFALQQEATRNQISEKMRQMDMDYGPVRLQSEYVTQAIEIQNRFRDEINATSQAIEDIHLKLTEENDPFQRAELEKTLAALEAYRTKLGDVAKTITAEGLLVRETWRQVGDIFVNGISDTLTNLITGTKSLKDSLTDMFDQITAAAARYIVKLLIIKALDAAMPGLGTAFGGAFANGGVFPGKIKAFANGGLISGPTMFGLAGEKGTEAIMPLERIGGKLGVRAMTDGGGGTTVINISAIDTQSGMEFLRKNADSIVSTLDQKRRLNRGLDRTR